MMSKIFIWLKIIRPQTLFASICPVLVGLIITPCISTSYAIITLLCAISLQVLSNLINDYYDYVRGSDKKGRVGFSRALAEGIVSKRQMLTACIITLCISIFSGLYLVLRSGIPILIIGMSAIFFAWLYTATSHSLSYLGIADIFVFIYYGVVATMGTQYIQILNFTEQAFWAGSVCGLISMCVLITNNLRDIEDDKAAGKRTFPVRFGKNAGELGYLVVILLTPLFSYMAFGLNWQMLIVVPGLALFYKVYKATGKEYNKCLLLAGILNSIYVILCLC